MKRINEKGFTLIELLAVIVILGVVMAIAIPSMNKVIDNSKKDTLVSTAQEYINGAKTMLVSENSLPDYGKALIQIILIILPPECISNLSMFFHVHYHYFCSSHPMSGMKYLQGLFVSLLVLCKIVFTL